MQVPSTKDMTQLEKKITDVPEIRVWCCPQKINKDGSDYYHTFKTFKKALAFIKKHPEAEEVPLIAFKGYELNLWGIDAKSA